MWEPVTCKLWLVLKGIYWMNKVTNINMTPWKEASCSRNVHIEQAILMVCKTSKRSSYSHFPYSFWMLHINWQHIQCPLKVLEQNKIYALYKQYGSKIRPNETLGMIFDPYCSIPTISFCWKLGVLRGITWIV